MGLSVWEKNRKAMTKEIREIENEYKMNHLDISELSNDDLKEYIQCLLDHPIPPEKSR
jgi:hypothetical protein